MSYKLFLHCRKVCGSSQGHPGIYNLSKWNMSIIVVFDGLNKSTEVDGLFHGVFNVGANRHYLCTPDGKRASALANQKLCVVWFDGTFMCSILGLSDKILI